MIPSKDSPELQSILAQVQAFARSRGEVWYLVGGMVRDQLLGRPMSYWNLDMALPRGALEASHQLANVLGGAFVPLDDVNGSARVVVASKAGSVELDISDFRGPTLEKDLAGRDFTINAIAVSLDDWLLHPDRPGPLIDPLGGAVALQQQRLVPCFAETFEEDPVRILRAFRFVAQLGFLLEPSARPLMARALPRLALVSGERIRDELLAILETNRAYPAVQSLNELGVLDLVFPELSLGRDVAQGDFHHLDVLGHQVETVAQGDRFLADFAEFSEPLRRPLAAYCAEQLVDRRSRKSLIKLSGLLHDVGKPARRTIEPDGEIWFLGHEHTGAELTVEITKRLRLSNRESEMVYRLVLHHLRPGFLSREPHLTRRAVYRFFKELGDDGPGCLLTWWADRMATRGPRSRLDQINQQRSRLEELLNAYFFHSEEVVKPVRLTDGDELMRMFDLRPGPYIGQMLGAIEEAQAEGRIRTKEEALTLAREILKGTPEAPAP